jgi:hypothetical protein
MGMTWRALLGALRELTSLDAPRPRAGRGGHRGREGRFAGFDDGYTGFDGPRYAGFRTPRYAGFRTPRYAGFGGGEARRGGGVRETREVGPDGSYWSSWQRFEDDREAQRRDWEHEDDQRRRDWQAEQDRRRRDWEESAWAHRGDGWGWTDRDGWDW